MSEAELRHIWLCADDYGLSPAVSAAIRDLIAHRRINATSVMMPAPSFSPPRLWRSKKPRPGTARSACT